MSNPMPSANFTAATNLRSHLRSGVKIADCYFTLTDQRFPNNFAIFIGVNQAPTQRVVRIKTELLPANQPGNNYLLVQDLANLIQQNLDVNNVIVQLSDVEDLIDRFVAAYV